MRGKTTPINQERIAKLNALGLNEQQARAYLALLDVPSGTVHELAQVSRVPRAKLYEVMESLNRKGLVDIIPDTPQRFKANPLTALYDTRMEELRAEEVQLKRTVAELSIQFVPPARQAAAEEDHGFAHLAQGRPQYPVRTRQLIREAKRSLTILGDKLFLARLRIYEDLVRLLALAAEKIPVRILLPENVVEQIEGRRIHVDELEETLRRGGLVLGDVTVLVRDQEEYLVTHFIPNDLHPSRGGDRLLWGNDPEMAAAWHQLIASQWEAARKSADRSRA